MHSLKTVKVKFTLQKNAPICFFFAGELQYKFFLHYDEPQKTSRYGDNETEPCFVIDKNWQLKSCQSSLIRILDQSICIQTGS